MSENENVFNTNEHEYLGTIARSWWDCDLFVAGDEVAIPLLSVDAVIFPGETVPLVIGPQNATPAVYDYLKAMIKESATRAPVIGAAMHREVRRQNGERRDRKWFPVGTLLHVRSTSTSTSSDSGTGEGLIHAVCVARHRFHILGAAHGGNGATHHCIRVLPDVDLIPPSCTLTGDVTHVPRQVWRWFSSERLCAAAYDKARSCHLFSDVRVRDASSSSADPQAVSSSATTFTQPPASLSITAPDRSWHRFGAQTSEFSWWLAQTVPLPMALKLALLCEAAVPVRLRLLMAHMNENAVLACASCNSHVCLQADTVELSSSKLMALFTNPVGHMHRLLTVRRILPGSLECVSPPSTEFSWFRGYAWTIVQCASCGAHVGWRFDWTSRTGREPDGEHAAPRYALANGDNDGLTILDDGTETEASSPARIWFRAISGNSFGASLVRGERITSEPATGMPRTFYGLSQSSVATVFNSLNNLS